MWAVRLQSVRLVGPNGLTDQSHVAGSGRPVGPTIVPCKRQVRQRVTLNIYATFANRARQWNAAGGKDIDTGGQRAVDVQKDSMNTNLLSLYSAIRPLSDVSTDLLLRCSLSWSDGVDCEAVNCVDDPAVADVTARRSGSFCDLWTGTTWSSEKIRTNVISHRCRLQPTVSLQITVTECEQAASCSEPMTRRTYQWSLSIPLYCSVTKKGLLKGKSAMAGRLSHSPQSMDAGANFQFRRPWVNREIQSRQRHARTQWRGR